MKTDRFPYETSRWAGGSSAPQAKDWFDELEMIGPQNVRARLAQTDAGSAGAIAIGSIPYLTIGFAQEWLAWHDQKREALEAQRHSREVFWTRFPILVTAPPVGHRFFLPRLPAIASGGAVGWWRHRGRRSCMIRCLRASNRRTARPPGHMAERCLRADNVNGAVLQRP